jgi:signal transduction histidine kinase
VKSIAWNRVVQILVDFTRPARDLHLEQIDLKHVLEDVAQLAAPDAEQRGVNLRTNFPEISLPVTADSDFIEAGRTECGPQRRAGNDQRRATCG